jgi:hypothetical protein
MGISSGKLRSHKPTSTDITIQGTALVPAVEGALRIFEAARQEIASAETVDQVKHVLTMATGLAAAARKATNKEVEAEAAVLKLEAERKLGQLMAAQKATVGVNKGGRPKTGLSDNPVSEAEADIAETKPATLAEAGIDKNLAHQARAAAAMSEPEFEVAKEAKREEVVAPVKRKRRSSKEVRDEQVTNSASFVVTTITTLFDSGNKHTDAVIDHILAKHIDGLIEIAQHPKFAPILAAVVAKLGGNVPSSRELEIREIGWRSENEELRARIAELEAVVASNTTSVCPDSGGCPGGGVTPDGGATNAIVAVAPHPEPKTAPIAIEPKTAPIAIEPKTAPRTSKPKRAPAVVKETKPKPWDGQLDWYGRSDSPTAQTPWGKIKIEIEDGHYLAVLYKGSGGSDVIEEINGHDYEDPMGMIKLMAQAWVDKHDAEKDKAPDSDKASIPDDLSIPEILKRSASS